MKTLLKFYKMFYRLLRLKKNQRDEIFRRFRNDFHLIHDNLYKEFQEIMLELKDWKQTANTFGINDPYTLFKVLNGDQIPPSTEITEARKRFVKDLMQANYKKKEPENGKL